MVEGADTPLAKKAREKEPADMRLPPAVRSLSFDYSESAGRIGVPSGGHYWPRWVVSGRLGEGCTRGPYRVLSWGVSRTTSAGGLASRRPRNRGGGSSPPVGHSLEPTSATRRGVAPWPPDRARVPR